MDHFDALDCLAPQLEQSLGRRPFRRYDQGLIIHFSDLLCDLGGVDAVGDGLQAVGRGIDRGIDAIEDGVEVVGDAIEDGVDAIGGAIRSLGNAKSRGQLGQQLRQGARNVARRAHDTADLNNDGRLSARDLMFGARYVGDAVVDTAEDVVEAVDKGLDIAADAIVDGADALADGVPLLRLETAQ